MNAGGRLGAWASRLAGGFAFALVAGCAAGNSVDTITGDSGVGGDATLDGSGDEGGGKTDGPSGKDGTTGKHPDASHDSGVVDAGHHDATGDGATGDAAACIAPQEKCGSSCTNTSEDPQNCGACGHACSSGLVCSSGTCAVGCSPGQLRCGADGGTVVVDASSTPDAASDASDAAVGDSGAGMNPSGQYCADPTDDRLNCGACGNICPSGPHSTPVCSGSACSLTCDPNYADCDGKASNGCEVETDNNPASCGACGVVCAQVNDTASCIAGVCGIASCNAGFANCDGMARNGCETPTNNVSNCGGCGNTCMAQNGTPGCPAGACTVLACNTGYGDCNNMASDGCETATTSSVNNCGGCGSVCVTPNGTPSCVSSKCTIVSCNAGFADCDNNPGDGCEVNIETNAANCGGCGSLCMLAHASAGCSAGTCTIAACDAGWGDCDGIAANGCETNIDTSVGNCGTCGHTCSEANGTAGCSGGTCTVASCDPGFADCNMLASDGCEVNTTSNASDCGSCGHACSEANASAKCVASSCAVANCSAGFADCNGNETDGCEVNTTDDPNNCGACGKSCLSTCGGAGDDVAAATCGGSTCSVTVCDTGYSDFNHSCANGCECKASTAPTVCTSAQSLFTGVLAPGDAITTYTGNMAPPATVTQQFFTLNFGTTPGTSITYHPKIVLTSSNPGEFVMDVTAGGCTNSALTTCSDNGDTSTGLTSFEETYFTTPPPIADPISYPVSGSHFEAIPSFTAALTIRVYRKNQAAATCGSFTINASE